MHSPKFSDIAKQYQEHPVVVGMSSLAVIVTVATPIFLVFGTTPAIAVTSALFGGLGSIAMSCVSKANPQPPHEQVTTPLLRPSVESRAGQAVRHSMRARLGDQARVDYYVQRVKKYDPNDPFYRELVEYLRHDPQWHGIAAAADSWVSIGLQTLADCQYHPLNLGTKNALYRAAIEAFAMDEIHLPCGEAFANHVKNSVEDRRLHSTF